jgi:hypothetical protein
MKFKGYCYLVISIPQPPKTFIGQKKKLKKWLHQHNSGWSHHWTDDISYRPWVYFAYVVGFQKRSQRLYFKHSWQHLVENSFPHQSEMLMQILHVCELAISKYHEDYSIVSDVGKLRLIQLLSLTS